MKIYAHPVRWASIFWAYMVVFMWAIHWSRRAQVGYLIPDVVGNAVGAPVVYALLKRQQ